MHSTVVLDGELKELADVRLEMFITGFSFGAGLFETVAVEAGRPVFLHRHLRRLRNSLEALGGTIEGCSAELLRPDALLESVAPALRACSPDAPFEGVMKLIVSGGHLLVTLREQGADHSRRVAGVTLDELDHRTYRANDPLRNHKTLAYLANYRVMSRGLLFCNERDEVCEAPTANVICELDGQLVTPPLSAPCLPGIIREVCLQLGQIAGRPFREGVIGSQDLARIDACVLTNAVAKAIPVTRMLGRAIESGSARLAADIRAALAAHHEIGDAPQTNQS